MSAKDKRYFNRELSWLGFNERVLEEAADPALPLLERVKFLAITASNLDEFFMVRVGGLMLLRGSGSRSRDLTGMTPGQQLRAVLERADEFMKAQYSLLNDTLMSELEAAGVRNVRWEDLAPGQMQHLERYFHESVYPILTPVALPGEEEREEDGDDGVFVPGLRLSLACSLRREGEEVRHAIVPVPGSLPRFLNLPDSPGFAYVTLEELMARFLHTLFPGEEVVSTAVFRVTRNGDIAVQDEEAADLADEMEAILAARKTSGTVRLEISRPVPRELAAVLKRVCRVGRGVVQAVPGLLDLKALMGLASVPGFDEYKITPWPPQASPQVDPAASIFDVISEQDVLLIHPYESFDPVVRLVEEAAEDPDVLAIKQILYRTAGDSRILDALLRAAQAGKQVTVLVELRARFDEARNLDRAEELRRAGAHILYGVRGLKTHAKALLVVRNEGGRLKRYVHFGTGNYNEATARLYTDVSYLTARTEYGADASAFFNAVTGRSREAPYLKLAAAPHTLKSRVIDLIASETERALQGYPARIRAKMNSLQDSDVIDALYEASQAGVPVQLNVRGICCLRPGVKGLSENIEVVSVIDRYLEHARIAMFHQGGRDEVYLSSADWMVRNLEKRIELMVPVEDPAARKRLVRYLAVCFDDNEKARILRPGGGHERRKVVAREKRVRGQQVMFKAARKAAKSARRHLAEGFVPHVPKT